MQGYPEGVDCVWLAVDDRGMLAGFITAGSGPIPGSVLAHATDVADIEGLLQDLLPAASEASLRVEIPKADSYLALCRRGFHVYDWTDIHASAARSKGTYELVAVPSKPLFVGQLPAELRILACPVADGQLIGAERIDVRSE